MPILALVLLAALMRPAVAATPAAASAESAGPLASVVRTPASAVQAAAAHAASEGVTEFLSVVDRTTGAVVAETPNANQQVASESIMKLFLAAYYLVSHGGYTHTPSSLLGRLSYMLRYSDDETADELFTAKAIPAMAARYGLHSTSNAANRVGYWGAARITARDMTQFLYRAAHDPEVGPWLLPVMAHAAHNGSDGFDQHFGLNALSGVHGSKQGWGLDSYWTAKHVAIHSVGYTSRYFVAILQLSNSYPDPARSTATYAAKLIQAAVAQPPRDGAFVRQSGSSHTYRLAGGAPVFVSSWKPFGGAQPVRALDAATWDALRTVPANGTTIRAGAHGIAYVIAGGAPIRVTDWSSIGGYRSPVIVDPAAVDHAGGSGAWSHLRAVPANGTLIRSGPHGPVYRITGGAPVLVTHFSGTPVVVDPVAIEHAGGRGSWSHLRLTKHDAACRPYPDVNGLNPHCGNISWLKGQAITKPADGLYHPLSDVSRGSMTAFLFRLTHPGKAQPSCTHRPFPDVPVSYRFCGYIAWAVAHHVAFGYSDGLYRPGNAVTRGAMAAYLHRIAVPAHPAAACARKPFADVPVHSTFCGVIAWMKAKGITYGVGGGTDYGTRLPVTRQAMASFLHRIARFVGD